MKKIIKTPLRNLIYNTNKEKYGRKVAGKKVQRFVKRERMAGRVVALALSAITALTVYSEANENKDIYMVDIPIEKIEEVIKTEELSQLGNTNTIKAICQEKEDDTYNSILITEGGKLIQAELNESVLKGINKELINIDSDEYELDVSMVTNSEGTILKQNKTLGKQTEVKLEEGKYLISGILETSSENSNNWKQVISVDEKGKIEIGYVNNEDITNLNYDSLENTGLNVTADKLNLRTTPGFYDNIITQVEEGTKLIKAGEAIDGWVPVIYSDEESFENIKAYASEQYLEVEKEAEISTQTIIDTEDLVEGKIEGKQSNLVLKTEPNKKSESVAIIESGTIAYKNEKDNDSKWTEVTLSSGVSGYIEEKCFEENIEPEKTTEISKQEETTTKEEVTMKTEEESITKENNDKSEKEENNLIKQLKNLKSQGIRVGENSKEYDIQSIRDKYWDSIEKWSKEYGLESNLVLAMICQESSGNEYSDNGYAYGLMQWEYKANKDSFTVMNAQGEEKVVPKTEKEELIGNSDLQIQRGCEEFKSRLDLYKGNLAVALQSYNYGPSGIRRCLGYQIMGNERNENLKNCGATDEQIRNYIESFKVDWIGNATNWYSESGCTWFGSWESTHGDKNYVENVLRYCDLEKIIEENTTEITTSSAEIENEYEF